MCEVLVISLVLSMVIPMFLGLLGLPLKFVQSFGTVPDEQSCAHKGIFFFNFFFLLVDGLNCWLKISQPSVSRICGLIVEVLFGSSFLAVCS